MMLTKEDLDNLSLLARVTVREEEKDKMLADMQAILGYVSEINEIQGDLSVAKDSHYNIVREDIVTRETGSNTVGILAEAPETEDDYVKVKQVLK
jgi:aspartyl-tRNA(Asn)/glutamyl-tRNA(Gln) amidotransferase subunit C